MTESPKWAVETRNTETGETIRLIETILESTADILAGAANAYFKRAERAYQSFVVKA